MPNSFINLIRYSSFSEAFFASSILFWSNSFSSKEQPCFRHCFPLYQAHHTYCVGLLSGHRYLYCTLPQTGCFGKPLRHIILQVTTLPHGPPSLSPARGRGVPVHDAKPPRLPVTETGAAHILYWCSLKLSRNYLRGFLIAA